ncbi:hypothetical protein HGRIS_006695 [Hohenbuehelia grisea]|uniref:Protein kinase domain-containing protein n=1 Tax=Hohenbuehelia grisea TaxID=104357 RepID=A0ABR3JA18_9AGAR
MYIDPYHPFYPSRKLDLTGDARYHSRTRKPVKYYILDFGLSRKYEASSLPALEAPIFGGDKSVPEFQVSLEPCDPFPTDVYYLGNLIRRSLTEGWAFAHPVFGLDFIKPLIADMVQDDPSKRPTMEQVAERFDESCAGLSSWTLRSRVARKYDPAIAIPFVFLAHWGRRIMSISRRRPAIPSLSDAV